MANVLIVVLVALATTSEPERHLICCAYFTINRQTHSPASGGDGKSPQLCHIEWDINNSKLFHSYLFFHANMTNRYNWLVCARPVN